MNRTKVAFINRDGTLIFQPPAPEILKRTEELVILPGVIEGLQNLLLKDYRLVMVSNQEGLGTKMNPSKEFNAIQNELLGLLSLEGITFDKIFICPHQKKEWCLCRKPRIALVEGYIRDLVMDYRHSFVIGNESDDAEFAYNIQLSFIKVEINGRFPSIQLV